MSRYIFPSHHPNLNGSCRTQHSTTESLSPVCHCTRIYTRAIPPQASGSSFSSIISSLRVDISSGICGLRVLGIMQINEFFPIYVFGRCDLFFFFCERIVLSFYRFFFIFMYIRYRADWSNYATCWELRLLREPIACKSCLWAFDRYQIIPCAMGGNDVEDFDIFWSSQTEKAL